VSKEKLLCFLMFPVGQIVITFWKLVRSRASFIFLILNSETACRSCRIQRRTPIVFTIQMAHPIANELQVDAGFYLPQQMIAGHQRLNRHQLQLLLRHFRAASACPIKPQSSRGKRELCGYFVSNLSRAKARLFFVDFQSTSRCRESSCSPVDRC
jgi:hypothetical protein